MVLHAAGWRANSGTLEREAGRNGGFAAAARHLAPCNLRPSAKMGADMSERAFGDIRCEVYFALDVAPTPGLCATPPLLVDASRRLAGGAFVFDHPKSASGMGP